jgi:hypothetical protein
LEINTRDNYANGNIIYAERNQLSIPIDIGIAKHIDLKITRHLNSFPSHQ